MLELNIGAIKWACCDLLAWNEIVDWVLDDLDEMVKEHELNTQWITDEDNEIMWFEIVMMWILVK